MTVTVTLNNYELIVGSEIGKARRIASINSNLNKHKHANYSNWATDIDGACAEMAVAKHKGWYWAGDINTFKRPDVGGIQVRSTTHRDGSLIIRKNDADDERFVLVITDVPNYHIIGSILGRDAKQHKYLRRGSNGEADAWFVPQQDLTPVKQAA